MARPAPSSAAAASRPPAGSPAVVQHVLVDSWRWRGLSAVAASYALAVVVLAIAAAYAPPIVESLSLQPIAGACPAPLPPDTSCIVAGSTFAVGLQPLNQVAAVTLALDRPTNRDGGLAAPTQHVTYPQPFNATVFVSDGEGGDESIFASSSGELVVDCPPGAVACVPSPFLVFVDLRQPRLRILASLSDPIAPWRAADATVRPDARTVFQATMMRYTAEYSGFLLGWRYFFVTAAIASFLAYSYLLRRAPGAVGGQGQRLVTGMEQRWVWALSLLLVLFDDPLLALTLLVPSVGAAAMSALFTVTFLAVLFLYIMVHLHVAALQTEAAQMWQLEPAAMRRLGCCFWAPKLIIVTLLWVLGLATYLWTRVQVQSNPAYTVANTLAAASAAAGSGLNITLLIIALVAVLYVFALLVISCRQSCGNLRRMRGSHSLFLTLSMLTLMLLLVGVGIGAFTPSRATSAAMLVVYGAVNAYVFVLMVAHLPMPRTTIADRIDDEAMRGGAAAGIDTDTTGVMGLHGVDVDLADIAGVGGVASHAAYGARLAAGRVARGGAPALATERSDTAPSGAFVIEEDDEEGTGLGAAAGVGGAEVAVPVADAAATAHEVVGGGSDGAEAAAAAAAGSSGDGKSV